MYLWKSKVLLVRNKPDRSANRLYIFSVIASLPLAGEATSFNEPKNQTKPTRQTQRRNDSTDEPDETDEIDEPDEKDETDQITAFLTKSFMSI